MIKSKKQSVKNSSPDLNTQHLADFKNQGLNMFAYGYFKSQGLNMFTNGYND